MPNLKTSEYVNETVELLGDNDLVDVSTEISPGVYRTDKIKSKYLKGVQLLGSATVTGNGVFAATWNCSGKRVTPTMIVIKYEAGATSGNNTLQINKNAISQDIMSSEVITTLSDEHYVFALGGRMPKILSDTDTMNVEQTVAAASSPDYTVEIHGTHEDE